ncbi:hypothetical protein H1P_2670008 [Hyella patelloides LEGE 07179]|uniref:Uncharacterized protein n=1 Tax=Hyella patelloides LEGE 07179 TaxID=945734 RepID=A0A563VST3_9CYAN|nr:hypothetical protein H1P_2670008 [Hyella patelloides LEGE 07179]
MKSTLSPKYVINALWHLRLGHVFQLPYEPYLKLSDQRLMASKVRTQTV